MLRFGGESVHRRYVWFSSRVDQVVLAANKEDIWFGAGLIADRPVAQLRSRQAITQNAPPSFSPTKPLFTPCPVPFVAVGETTLETCNCFLFYFSWLFWSIDQDRITDHRASYSRHGWDAMMRGELLEAFLDALAEKSRSEQLKAAGLQGVQPSPLPPAP